MRKNILNKGALFLILLIAFGCKTQKHAIPAKTTPKAAGITPEFSKTEVLATLTGKQINYNSASIKAKAGLTINNNSHDVNMNIRMQKDNAIWVSVTVIAGLEVARALITPDSIKILNRLESTYISKPFSYIYQFASREVNFNTLQDIFIGNALAGTLSQSSTVDISTGQTQVKGTLEKLAYILTFNQSNNLIQSNLTDPAASQVLSINYSEHRNIGNQEIPHVISIKSNAGNKSIGIDLRYTSVGLNESLDFPFSVPKRFTLKD